MPPSIRGDDFLNFSQSETRISHGDHVFYPIRKHFALFVQAVAEQKIFFRNLPTRNKNCLWWPCFLTDRNNMTTLYRRPSIHVGASYHVLVHLVKRFQKRRFKCEKLMDHGHCDGKSSHGLSARSAKKLWLLKCFTPMLHWLEQ